MDIDSKFRAGAVFGIFGSQIIFCVRTRYRKLCSTYYNIKKLCILDYTAFISPYVVQRGLDCPPNRHGAYSYVRQELLYFCTKGHFRRGYGPDVGQTAEWKI